MSVTGKKWDDGTAPVVEEKDELDLDDLGLEPMEVGDDDGEEFDEEAKREAEALSARTRKLVVQEDGSVARRGTRKREPAVSKQVRQLIDLTHTNSRSFNLFRTPPSKTSSRSSGRSGRSTMTPSAGRGGLSRPRPRRLPSGGVESTLRSPSRRWTTR